MADQEQIDAHQDAAQNDLKEAGRNMADAAEHAGEAIQEQADETADKLTGEDNQ